MIEEIKNIKSTKKELWKFGVTISVVLIIISGFLYWKENLLYPYTIGLSVIIISTGMIKPVLLKPFYFIWMTMATILGWIMTRLILSVLFYLVFTLIGLIPRLFGRQFLQLRWDKKVNTYWNYRERKQPEKDSYEKQF